MKSAAVVVMACCSVFPASQTRPTAKFAIHTETAVTSASRQQSVPPRLFTFETDEFWLNLHHFLYVLGRGEAKMPDMSEPSVAGAPREAERALQNLTREEQIT